MVLQYAYNAITTGEFTDETIHLFIISKFSHAFLKFLFSLESFCTCVHKIMCRFCVFHVLNFYVDWFCCCHTSLTYYRQTDGFVTT